MTRSIVCKRVAFLATDAVEQVELDRPWQVVLESGAQPRLVSLWDWVPSRASTKPGPPTSCTAAR